MPVKPAKAFWTVSSSFLDLEGRAASFSGSFLLTPNWWGGKSTELGVRWILVWILALPLCNWVTVGMSLNPRTSSIKWKGQNSLLLSESVKENVHKLALVIISTIRYRIPWESSMSLLGAGHSTFFPTAPLLFQVGRRPGNNTVGEVLLSLFHEETEAQWRGFLNVAQLAGDQAKTEPQVF